MIQLQTFSAAADRSAGERINMAAPQGGTLVVDGDVPADLTITPVSSTGGPINRPLAIRASGGFRESFDQIIVTHAPVTNGKTFTVAIGERDSWYDAGLSHAVQYLTTGTGTQRVPARVANNVLQTDQAGATTLGTILTCPAGRRIRLLGYSFQVAGGYKLAAAGEVSFSIRDAAGGAPYGYHTLWVPAVETPGVLFNSGFIPLGDGILNSVGSGIALENVSLAPSIGAGRLTVMLHYNLE